MVVFIFQPTACTSNTDCTPKNTECRDDVDMNGLICKCIDGFLPQADSGNGDCAGNNRAADVYDTSLQLI